MRSVIVRSLVVIGAGAIVLAGVLYVASTVDGRAPGVLAVRLTQPVPDDDRLALVTTSVEIVFSEPVDSASAEAAVAIAPEVTTAASWSGSTMTITPVDALALDTGYVLTIAAGIRDRSGNAMTEAPPDFEFATVGRPVLAATNPPDGAIDVPLDPPVALTFSTLMDTVSVEAALSIEPAFAHELRWSGRLLTIIPTEPLTAGTEYRVEVGESATDTAGVHLGQPSAFTFRTLAAGFEVATVVPTDGAAGIATTTPIVAVFDGPIDPASVSGDLVTVTPDAAGTVEVTPLPGEAPDDDGAGRALVFQPSAPLPANTTFTIEIAPGLVGLDGGTMAEPLTWSFTTGVPATGISNQVTFITERSGVANVWAMNPDGSGQRQVSAELTPVVDYVLAPNGDSLVVSDGRRLVFVRADGSERRVLTDAAAFEFDPAYSPDGRRVVFARADALTGVGRGLWEWDVGGGDAEPIELPVEAGASPTPVATGAPTGPLLRAPRYAPDGRSLAFVDGAGAIVILDLEEGSLTRHPLVAAGAPTWLPDGSAILVDGSATGPVTTTVAAPVLPLQAAAADAVHLVDVVTGSVAQRFALGSTLVAIAVDGRIAYAENGVLWIGDATGTGPGRRLVDGVTIGSGWFSPGAAELVVEVTGPGRVRLEVVDPESGDRVRLITDAARPRWQP
jgi:hypothetical protein